MVSKSKNRTDAEGREKMKRKILFIGPSSSGKTTGAEYVQERYGYKTEEVELIAQLIVELNNNKDIMGIIECRISPTQKQLFLDSFVVDFYKGKREFYSQLDKVMEVIDKHIPISEKKNLGLTKEDLLPDEFDDEDTRG